MIWDTLMYDRPNSFSPAFVYIHRAKYIFSRDIFCFDHFKIYIKELFIAHREFLLRNGVGKTCLWKKYILLYECIQKQGKRIFEIVHWPFELPPNQHRPTSPLGWHKWYSLTWPSKEQYSISKIISSLIFSLFIEQNIFFPETCFAYTISEPKFTVCIVKISNSTLTLECIY